LHDNISQTLYAVCLTLESVQKKGALAPDLQQRVDQCMAELRRLNQEVRAYLRDLEPASVASHSFTGALNDLIASIAAGQDVRIEQKLDDEAVALIPPIHIAEIMNILREALSNSLRHGRARHITLLAGRSEETVALAVQDDGLGFTPAPERGRGHGLGNMQARAAALGGSLRIESAAGKGTRVLLTLPVASLA
jgi:signal transduction histidine kinase